MSRTGLFWKFFCYLKFSDMSFPRSSPTPTYHLANSNRSFRTALKYLFLQEAFLKLPNRAKSPIVGSWHLLRVSFKLTWHFDTLYYNLTPHDIISLWSQDNISLNHTMYPFIHWLRNCELNRYSSRMRDAVVTEQNELACGETDYKQ